MIEDEIASIRSRGLEKSFESWVEFCFERIVTMIIMKNTTIGYTKDNPVLSEWEYSFENNKIYTILGESGCGKTTLLRTIAGLMKPISGEVLLDGHPVRSKKEDKYKICMLHQNYTSFGWLTCMENTILGSKVRKEPINKEDLERAYEMLCRVGLEEKLNKYPGELSGGQRQRLALARIVFMEPEIMLLDEPLSALDPVTRASMQDLIREVHSKTNNTVIMVTHSVEEAERLGDVVIKWKRKEETNGII